MTVGVVEFPRGGEETKLARFFKVHKIIFPVNLTVCSNRQIDGGDFVNFCGLLRINEN